MVVTKMIFGLGQRRKIFGNIVLCSIVLYFLVCFFVFSFVSSESKIFALPQSPPSNPTLSLSLSSDNTNVHINSADTANANLKTNLINANVITNNITGYIMSFSDSDENTALEGDITNPFVVSSITQNTNIDGFPIDSWGYSLDDATFKPIPKKSVPEIIRSTNSATASTGQNTTVKIGVKASSNLWSDTYRGVVEISVVTNALPKTATFLRGKLFTTELNNQMDDQVDKFKHSPTPPADFSTASIVSEPESEYPIYAWNDTSKKTIYWWSQADIAYMNEDAGRMFWGLSNNYYRGMQLDLRGINTSKTKNMKQMFLSEYSNYSVNYLDLSDFDTSNVTDMSEMFKGCHDLISLDLSSFNTAKVENMAGMFNGMDQATILDLASFDTGNVKYMNDMFANMEKIIYLNISTFSTANVEEMAGMFREMHELTGLNLSHFVTNKVQGMSQMFENMSKLTSLNIANFNTSEARYMAGMFRGTRLKMLDLSHFDTSKVVYMNQMFENMADLVQLNIKNFNTINTTHMAGMFNEAKQLKVIMSSDMFVTTNVVESNLMFNNNHVLTGGAGTTYSESNPKDKTYARIDRNGSPGYFSYVP